MKAVRCAQRYRCFSPALAERTGERVGHLDLTRVVPGDDWVTVKEGRGPSRENGGTRMRTIGLIGGMSWESSAEYYRIINQLVQHRLGGLHSARILMYSVDFDEIEKLQQRAEWEKATELMIDAAKRLEEGGADLLLICTNTMHRMAPEVQAEINIPLLHIVDATAEEIKRRGIRKIGLLGTRYAMEQEFYRGRFSLQHGLEVVIPGEKARQTIHRVIYEELCVGRKENRSRNDLLRIIHDLTQQGAEGIVLGCTEIPLLIKQADCPYPLFDTTTIHAQKAVELALEG
jgi:aspartate racemase